MIGTNVRMEVLVTDRLTARTPGSADPVLGSWARNGAQRDSLYWMIHEHCIPASKSDVAAAWFAAGLVSLALLAVPVL